MKKYFITINWKIRRAILGTIIIVLVSGFFAHMSVFKESKNELIFEQLESLSQVKPKDESLFPTKFKMEKEGQMFDINVSFVTNAIDIGSKEYNKIINSIIEDMTRVDFKEDKGTINYGDLDYYYYLERGQQNNSITMFVTSSKRVMNIQVETIFFILGVLIVGLFSSRLLSIKIARPIQELKEFAEEISKRNWEAKSPEISHDEIGILAKSLEEMKNSLQKIEERERQFIQSTSHDLKTPVMIIKGYAQAMLDGVNINSELSMVKVIKTESDRMERKINQLLTLNVLGHSHNYYKYDEFVRVDKILSNLVEKFSLIKPEIRWQLIIKEVEVEGSSEDLLIAFENIIENQIRYANKLINISMNIDDKLEIKISNDGSKFENKNPMEIFDAYTKDNNGKFGLGLAIANQVIQNHKGQIEAYNTEDGVEFKIQLNY